MRHTALGTFVAGAAALTIATPTATAQSPAGLLPDLKMAKIADVAVYPFYDRRDRPRKGRWGVRFTTLVYNLGPGHLVLRTYRAKTGSPCTPEISFENRCEQGTMTVDQIVQQPDGTSQTFPGIARAYFDPWHFHWHMRYANRYELRSGDGKRRILRDVKSGFCFGDREANPATPNETAMFPSGLATCLYGSMTDPAQDGRRALEFTQGISVGWGDDYESFQEGQPLEGQQFEVTRLKRGTYMLVNVANGTGRIREVTTSNNVSFVRFRLSWPAGRRGKPRIALVGSCSGKPICARRARR